MENSESRQKEKEEGGIKGVGGKGLAINDFFV